MSCSVGLAPTSAPTGFLLSRHLHDLFVEYIKNERRRVPSWRELFELFDLFPDKEKISRRAVQAKFKTFSKKMDVTAEGHLILSKNKKIIIPKEEFIPLIKQTHEQTKDHVDIEGIKAQLALTFVWGRPNFGMDWDIVASVVSRCPKASCISKLQLTFLPEVPLPSSTVQATAGVTPTDILAHSFLEDQEPADVSQMLASNNFSYSSEQRRCQNYDDEDYNDHPKFIVADDNIAVEKTFQEKSNAIVPPQERRVASSLSRPSPTPLSPYAPSRETISPTWMYQSGTGPPYCQLYSSNEHAVIGGTKVISCTSRIPLVSSTIQQFNTDRKNKVVPCSSSGNVGAISKSNTEDMHFVKDLSVSSSWRRDSVLTKHLQEHPGSQRPFISSPDGMSSQIGTAFGLPHPFCPSTYGREVSINKRISSQGKDVGSTSDLLHQSPGIQDFARSIASLLTPELVSGQNLDRENNFKNRETERSTRQLSINQDGHFQSHPHTTVNSNAINFKHATQYPSSSDKCSQNLIAETTSQEQGSSLVHTSPHFSVRRSPLPKFSYIMPYTLARSYENIPLGYENIILQAPKENYSLQSPEDSKTGPEESSSSICGELRVEKAATSKDKIAKTLGSDGSKQRIFVSQSRVINISEHSSSEPIAVCVQKIQRKTHQVVKVIKKPSKSKAISESTIKATSESNSESGDVGDMKTDMLMTLVQHARSMKILYKKIISEQVEPTCVSCLQHQLDQCLKLVAKMKAMNTNSHSPEVVILD